MAEPGPVPSVDVTEAASRLHDAPSADGATARPLLVDVREPSEFEAVRVAGAVLVPLSEFQARHSELPADRPLLVMCAAGRRSLVASEFLLRNGYRDVSNVIGGITEWQRRGLETRSGQPEPGEGQLAPG